MEYKSIDKSSKRIFYEQFKNNFAIKVRWHTKLKTKIDNAMIVHQQNPILAKASKSVIQKV